MHKAHSTVLGTIAVLKINISCTIKKFYLLSLTHSQTQNVEKHHFNTVFLSVAEEDRHAAMPFKKTQQNNKTQQVYTCKIKNIIQVIYQV